MFFTLSYKWWILIQQMLLFIQSSQIPENRHMWNFNVRYYIYSTYFHFLLTLLAHPRNKYFQLLKITARISSDFIILSKIKCISVVTSFFNIFLACALFESCFKITNKTENYKRFRCN